MDFRNAKDISVNGKSAKKVLLDGRTIWQKTSIIPVSNFIVMFPDTLHEGVNNVDIALGPAGFDRNDVELSITGNGLLVDGWTLVIDHIGGVGIPGYEEAWYCTFNVTEIQDRYNASVTVTAKSKSTGISKSTTIEYVAPEPEPSGVSVDLNGEWTESAYPKPSDCPEGYDMYMSDSNYHVDGSVATMFINFDAEWSGEYTIYINSYAESGFDYTRAWSPIGDWVEESTQNFQYDPSSNMEAWKAVVFDIPDTGTTHQIKIDYIKDTSTSSNYDRGFVLIPTQI